MRTQHPAQLGILHLDPIGATPPTEGEAQTRVHAAYASYWLAGGDSDRSFQMDGELLRVGYQARIGLTRTLELDTELGFAYAGGGFLDSFLIDYHGLLSLPDQGRENAPRNNFRVLAQREGTSVYEMNPYAVEPLDMPLAVVWHFLPCGENRPFGLGVRGGVELPLGDPNRGYGNGKLDYALGLVGEARLGMIALTGFAQHTFVGTPDRARRAGFRYRDVAAAGLGAEWLLSDDLSLLVQTEIQSSALRALELRQASHPQAELWLGGRMRLSADVAFEAALGEDLSRKTSPDVTGYFAFAFGLGRARGR